MNHNSNCIKICFVAPKAYPLFNPAVHAVFGGAEVDVYLIAKELAKDKRFEVSCITADYGQQAAEIIHDVKIIKSINFQRNTFSQATKLWKALNIVDAHIIFQEAASLGSFLVALYCKLKNKHFVYRTASQEECNGTYFKKYLLKGHLFKWALHHARQIITQNRFDSDNLIKYVDKTPMTIQNAHQIPMVSHHEPYTILWVGRSAPVKQPAKFIELVREMPGEHFTMICSKATGDLNYDQLKNKTAGLKNLDFIEYVPFHQMNSFFESARVLVNTSDSEGFPNTFIQAGMYSVPILSLNVNPDGFIDQFQCGKCANGKWNDLVEGLQFLLQQENNIKYGQKGRKYVEEHHDIAKIIEQYKNLLLEIQ